MRPRVTLAIPVYNGEKFISEAIRSILAQDYSDFELIITDNASTDSTEMICREFAAADARIKYVRNERNLGAGPNHNKGFELSSGEFFKWCACDDLISPEYLGQCVRALEKDPGVVIAFGATLNVDENGHRLATSGKTMPEMMEAQPARRFRTAVTSVWQVDQEMFGLFRSDALRRTSLHKSYPASDHNLLREMALLGRFALVPHIAFYNRDHAGRSAYIADGRERQLWWDTANNGGLYTFRYIAHLIKMTIRHRRLVSPARTLPCVLILAMSPRFLAYYSIELASFASPSAARWLHALSRWILRRARSVRLAPLANP